MAWFRPLGVLVFLLGLLTLASCGQSVAPVADNPGGVQGLQNSGSIPSIWDLDNVAGNHSASLMGNGGSMTVLGREYLENLVHNGTVDGDNLVLDSSLGGDGEKVAWAVYRYQNLLGKRPQALNVVASPGGLEQKYYVGLANYSSGNWEWFGPSSLPEFQIDLHENYNRYVTALGNMYFLVVAEGGDVVTHHNSTLTYLEGDGQVLPGAPHELVASDGAFADHVHVTWNAGEGATSYEVFRRKDGSNDDFVKIGETAGTEYDDTTGDSGVIYIYKARSKNDAGASNFSNTDSGYRGELPQGGDCPTGLMATDGTYTDKVRLEWTGSANTTYNVWRKPDGGGDFTKIGTAQGSSYNDTTAEPGVTYIYKVSGTHLGEQCYSNTDSGYRAQGQQEACPSNLAATDGTYTDKVRLEWAGQAGQLYRVYRRVTESQDAWGQIGATQDLGYNDTTAAVGVGYTYKVVWTVQDQEQCTSNEDTGYRAGNSQQENCPSALGASDGTYTDKVRLEWSGNANSLYDVYRRVDGGGDFAFLAETTGTSYNDESAEPGVTYIYKVGYELDGGQFCWSNTDSGFRAQQQQDDCPSNLGASDGTWEAGVHLEWSGVAGHAYDILRQSPNSQDWVLVATTQDGLAYLDTTAEPGVTYTYKVRKNGGDCVSNEDTGYRPGGQQ